MSEADAKVEAFRARTGLYESSENSSVPTQQLGEIATRLSEARAVQSELEAKARGLSDLLKQGRLADAGDISSNELVRRISENRVAVRSQLAVESRTLLPAHPRIKELEAQLSDIETQLRAAVEKAARGLESDARVAADQGRQSHRRARSSRKARSAPRTPMRRNCRNCSATPKS